MRGSRPSAAPARGAAGGTFVEQPSIRRTPIDKWGLPPVQLTRMQLRTINVGCFGGGTGLPSLLGGLKSNPWLTLNAVVTMFDSGGSSGQLRDELGVLPPGDVLRCALAMARNEREARRVLLARLPTMEHARLSGHTGGNLLLSMMERYSGDFLAAVEGLRSLLGCVGKVWPVSVESGEPVRAVRRRQHDARRGRGRRRPVRGQHDRAPVARALRQPAPGRGQCDPAVRCRDHRTRQLLHEPDADLPRARRAGSRPAGQGAGHPRVQPADRGARHVALHRRRSGARDERPHRPRHRRRPDEHRTAVRGHAGDATGKSTSVRSRSATSRSRAKWSTAISGWGEYARHERRRLAQAIWAVLARRLL